MPKKNVIIYSKERNKKRNTTNYVFHKVEVNKKKSIKSAIKFKCKKSNSVVQRNKPLEERKKTLQGELKKINEFRKILTRNSKIYARKYGDEILKKIISFNNKNNKKSNHEFIYNNKHKTKIPGRKFLSNKNIIFTNKAIKKLMKSSKKNINFNIINSFKIISEKNIKRKHFRR